MRLTENFHLKEFTRSATAERLNINNTPPISMLPTLVATARRLENIRAILLYNPVIISSGWRSVALNTAVGGASNSDHMKGLAVDFHLNGKMTPVEMIDWILASGYEFDQLIAYPTFLHIGWGERMRRQVIYI